MTSDADGRDRDPRKPLRLWPGVVAVGLQWLSRFVVPLVYPEWMLYGVLSGLVGGLVVLVWWAFFSRVPRVERWGAIVVMIAAMALTPRLLHPSVANGMMGLMFYLYVVPVLSLALVAWAVATRRLADGPRRATLVAAILLACGAWTLVRSDGIGDAGTDFAWRWSPTPEQRLLARVDDAPEPTPPPPVLADETPAEPEPTDEGPDEEPSPLPAAAPEGTEDVAVEAVAAWPGFRGPHRDGTLSGVRIDTDWSRTPPVELWRRPVGPGWSSFAVAGDLFYTQEQRGEEEVVSCYRVSTGEPVWRHGDGARFWEANAGAGPRATPTLSGGRVYSFGGTGILNALDAEDGSVVWSRDAASEAGARVPYWGFSSSPLVTDGVVVVWSGALVAYDAVTGDPRWSVPAGGQNYSSPRLLTIDGTPQVVAVSGEGATGVAPADGTVLWEHPWPGLPHPGGGPDRRRGRPDRRQREQRHPPPRGGAGTRRVVGRGALDLDRAEAVLQ